MEDRSDEGGVVIATGMITVPEVEALKEVTVGPSDEEAPDTADASVAEAETSLDRLPTEDVALESSEAAVDDSERSLHELSVEVAVGSEESVVEAGAASLAAEEDPVEEEAPASVVVADTEALTTSEAKEAEALDSTAEA